MTIYSDFERKKKEESKWLILDVGQKFSGRFLGAEPIKNRFGNYVLNYSFLDDEGRRKEFEEGSIVLSRQFEAVEKEFGPKKDVTIECFAADKINPKSGKPYKRYRVLVDGKPVLSDDEPIIDVDGEIPIIND